MPESSSLREREARRKAVEKLKCGMWDLKGETVSRWQRLRLLRLRGIQPNYDRKICTLRSGWGLLGATSINA